MDMKSFLSDCRPATSSAESEAFVISWCYGMGDPLAPSVSEENSGGGRLVRRVSGGHHPSVTP